MRLLLSAAILLVSLNSIAAEQGQQKQAVSLTCVARILNMNGSKAFYEQVPMKKIVDGRYSGPVDNATLSIDVSQAPFVAISLQLTSTKAIDVQGLIEPTTGYGPELTYTLDAKASAPKVESYLEVGCGLNGNTISFKQAPNLFFFAVSTEPSQK